MLRKRQTSTELRQMFDECSDVDSDSGDEIDYLPVEPPSLNVPNRQNFLADDDSDYDEMLAAEENRVHGG